MHPRLEELSHFLATTRGALRQTLDQVPFDLRERRPATDRWSVAEILNHLARLEMRLTNLFASRVEDAKSNGIAVEHETSSVLDREWVDLVLDRSRQVVAIEAVRPAGAQNASDAFAELEIARAAFLEFLTSADGLALGTLVFPHPALGQLNLYQWIAFIGAHEARHTAQIREVVSQLTALPGASSASPQG